MARPAAPPCVRPPLPMPGFAAVRFLPGAHKEPGQRAYFEVRRGSVVIPKRREPHKTVAAPSGRLMCVARGLSPGDGAPSEILEDLPELFVRLRGEASIKVHSITLSRQQANDPESLRLLTAWAVEYLKRALEGLDIQAFADPRAPESH